MTEISLHDPLGTYVPVPSTENPTAVEGLIAEAPATTTDPVFVTIPSFSLDHSFGPCFWPLRGATLPQPGDPCCVVFTEQRRAWVVAWMPA